MAEINEQIDYLLETHNVQNHDGDLRGLIAWLLGRVSGLEKELKRAQASVYIVAIDKVKALRTKKIKTLSESLTKEIDERGASARKEAPCQEKEG